MIEFSKKRINFDKYSTFLNRKKNEERKGNLSKRRV